MSSKIIVENISSNKADTRKEYLAMVISQYGKSIGFDKLDISSKNFFDELSVWIKERKKILPAYIGLLNYMNIEYDNYTTAEINKGMYDSIVSNHISTTIM